MTNQPDGQDWLEVLKISQIEVAYDAVHALEAAGIQAEVRGSGSSMPPWQVAVIGGPAALFGDLSVGPHHVMAAPGDLERATEVLRVRNIPARPSSIGS